jgi:transketolase
MDISSANAIALSVRSLSIDGVEAARSGHPGLPMGCAELGALLYGEVLNYFPDDPDWPNRDRFVLSAGHGSMFLYSLLHLAGFALPLDELKQFRQLGSRTPGHPEYEHTPGVETTTGPLGQGLGNAVGMAIAENMAAAIYNTTEYKIIDHYTYVLASDGDMMEGVSSEVCSLAGHLKLGKLIVFYDDNDISIDGSTDITFTEDVAMRFEAYGWHVQHVDGYDVEGISRAVTSAKDEQQKPSLIVLKTVIGKGSPNKAGTSSVHGAPLGPDEIKATREALGLDAGDEFHIEPEALRFFEERRKQLSESHSKWQATYKDWRAANPELAERWDRCRDSGLHYLKTIEMPAYEQGEAIATRKVSGKALNAIADGLPCLIGGSADLAGSNITAMPQHGQFSASDHTGRTINFGVREHAMGAISNGLALYGGFRPFCATFLVFSDYMRPSIRLAALMSLPVIYVFTHDSIFVGEDGPTHQPVEHVAALRTIPNLDVLRPGDAQECVEAWRMAVERTDGPTALVLTRQNLEVYAKADPDWKARVRRGAYVVRECDGEPDVVIVATGSEVNLALAAAGQSSQRARVVSAMSVKRLLEQDDSFRENLLPAAARIFTAEVGVRNGWEGLASDSDAVFSLDRFGLSGPGGRVAEHLEFTAADLLERIGG